MAGRIRSVHPGQWTDPDFLQMSLLARLFVLALRNSADDNGIFEWLPVRLKIELLPADNADVENLLKEATQFNQVKPYEVGRRKYGLIRNFHRFQKPRFPSYKYPPPPENVLDKDDGFLVVCRNVPPVNGADYGNEEGLNDPDFRNEAGLNNGDYGSPTENASDKPPRPSTFHGNRKSEGGGEERRVVPPPISPPASGGGPQKESLPRKRRRRDTAGVNVGATPPPGTCHGDRTVSPDCTGIAAAGELFCQPCFEALSVKGPPQDPDPDQPPMEHAPPGECGGCGASISEDLLFCRTCFLRFGGKPDEADRLYTSETGGRDEDPEE